MNDNGSYHYINVCFTVDCAWDAWTEWEACSETCGDGEQRRTRIMHPELHGGVPCTGEPEEWRECFDKHCPSMIILIYLS